MSANAFIKDISFYTRDVDPLRHYIEQSSFYLSKMTGLSKEVCISKIKEQFANKAFDIKNPEVTYFVREENGDRHSAKVTLREHISNIVKSNDILAPTMTTYVPESKKQSMLVEFIENNVKKRSIAKKEGFAAKAAGNIDLMIMKDNIQTNMKLYNNSMSGAFVTASSVLHNPTAHNTLTSITRTESSLSNSSNEKLISGNRHYFNVDVTLNNVISIASQVDKDSLLATITKYSLHYPTVEETLECIKYSTDLYWKDHKKSALIADFVNKLDDLERAAFVYTSDLYHIRKYNDNFIRTFITSLSKKVTDISVEDPKKVISETNEEVINLVHQICMKETKGIGKNYSLLNEHDLNTIAATCLNVINTIDTYRDFINTFFLTKNMPVSTAHIPHMVRRTVVLSDTDSTMFAVDEYVSWYFGELLFSDEAFAVAGSIMYLATQCIAHILAIFSANMGVVKEKTFKIAMKPEFVFPVFVPTSVAKHYFTCIVVKEGNVYKEKEMEIKGVHLKNSAMPKQIVSKAHRKMESIIETIMSNKKINLYNEIKEVAELERSIFTALHKGDIEYFSKSKIKNAEAYANEASKSPYQHYVFWQAVFEPKYGKIDPPPFNVVKIPTIVNNITEVKKWLEGIADKALSERLANWFLATNKTSLPTIYISVDYIRAFGLPAEIASVIDSKKIIMNLTIINRMILETLGYFPKPKLLLSEQGY